MTELNQAERKNEFHEMSLEKIEEIRSGLRERKGGLAVNQDMLFKHTAAPAGNEGNP